MKVANAVKAGLVMVVALISAYAVAAGGGTGNAQQTLQLAQVSEGFDPAATYASSCGACHNAGAGGAPRMGNEEEWKTRLDEKGFDTLLKHTIEGFGVMMPAKGMCFTCTDDELKVMLQYILDNSIEKEEEDEA